jgi:hypothetical protein
MEHTLSVGQSVAVVAVGMNYVVVGMNAVLVAPVNCCSIALKVFNQLRVALRQLEKDHQPKKSKRI